MLRLLKTLLLWFLIAALPLQGAAAASKTSCGPAHQVHQHMHVIGQGQSSGAHDASGKLLEPAATLVHDVNDSSVCSACAACCIGPFAPPPASLSASLRDGSENVLIPSSRLGTGYVPSGPERPPRRISL